MLPSGYWKRLKIIASLSLNLKKIPLENEKLSFVNRKMKGKKCGTELENFFIVSNYNIIFIIFIKNVSICVC